MGTKFCVVLGLVGVFLFLFNSGNIPGRIDRYFFPAPRVIATKNHCIANLKQIQIVIELWALEKGKTNREPVTITDISGSSSKFIKGLINRDITCPKGGIYKLTTVDKNPTCTYPGHTL